jgi:hypothetical protein
LDVLIKEGIQFGRKMVLRLMTEMALVPGPLKPAPYPILKKASDPKVCWDNPPTESFSRTLKMETGLAKAQLDGPAEVEPVLIDWIEYLVQSDTKAYIYPLLQPCRIRSTVGGIICPDQRRQFNDRLSRKAQLETRSVHFVLPYLPK